MSNAYKFFSGLGGSNVITVGKDPTTYQFLPTELQTAINSCPNGGVVILEPGTYTMTDPLMVYKPITLMCESPAIGTTDTGAIITSALAVPTVYVNVPASSGQTTIQNNFKNITFNNTNAGAVPCMEIDNDGGAALPFYLYFENCTFSHTGALGLDIKQTAVALGTELMYLNFSECTIGTVALAHPLAGDEFNCFRCIIQSTITMSAEATASIWNLMYCIYENATPTVGGNAAQLGNAFGNYYDASPFGGALTAGTAADFTDLGFAAAGPGFLCCGRYA
jgi:hypothetical protein